MRVFDDTGNYDTFTLSGVADASGTVTITSRPADSTNTTYPLGSKSPPSMGTPFHGWYQ